MKDWNLGNISSATTTDNGKCMMEGVKDLRRHFSADYSGRYSNERFHIRCIAHAIHLAICDCMKLIMAR